jgi:hypothetical protein
MAFQIQSGDVFDGDPSGECILLDGANEQPSGPKGPTELRNAKDAIAQEEFFDMALKKTLRHP